MNQFVNTLIYINTAKNNNNNQPRKKHYTKKAFRNLKFYGFQNKFN